MHYACRKKFAKKNNKNVLYNVNKMFFIVLIIALLLLTAFLFMPKLATPAVSNDQNVVVAENLHVPWSFVFLPDGSLLTTQRNGVLTHVQSTGAKKDITVNGVTEVGEGGLLGLALHPNFSQNNQIYLYFTTKNGTTVQNKVSRFVLRNDSLSDETIIIDHIPGGNVHNGGRIAFGPDGLLYVTTGDSGNDSLAQDKSSLAGKILRLNPDGTIPQSNPFQNAIYTLGHRNPQGLAWDNSGGLWATEHGRSGLASGLDEINYIVADQNYGWPTIQGDAEMQGLTKPVINSGSSVTWAPAGIVFKDGFLYFAGLAGESLYKIPVLGRGKLGQLETLYAKQYGRLRGLALDSVGTLYVSTSNKDGRGNSQANDDKIIKLIDV